MDSDDVRQECNGPSFSRPAKHVDIGETMRRVILELNAGAVGGVQVPLESQCLDLWGPEYAACIGLNYELHLEPNLQEYFSRSKFERHVEDYLAKAFGPDVAVKVRWSCQEVEAYPKARDEAKSHQNLYVWSVLGGHLVVAAEDLDQAYNTVDRDYPGRLHEVKGRHPTRTIRLQTVLRDGGLLFHNQSVLV